MGRLGIREVPCRNTDAVRVIALASALVVTGCSQSAPDNRNTEDLPSVEDQRLAAQAECIRATMDATIVRPKTTVATLDAMMAQNLSGCPNDFKSTFVALRAATRDYLQTLQEIAVHNREREKAVNRDLVNLGCSIFRGQQCASSSVAGWMDVNDTLKAHDAENRAAVQRSYNALEASAANYGVYIRIPNDSTSDSATGAADAAVVP